MRRAVKTMHWENAHFGFDPFYYSIRIYVIPWLHIINLPFLQHERFPCLSARVAERAQRNFDFSKPEYQGPKGNQKKKAWAEGLGIYWDGITDMYVKKGK